MISRVKVLATGEPTLDTLLQKGHEVEIDSPHVLVVGPNGSGKTAFLRLLYTSLMNKQFYDIYGKMRLRQLLPLHAYKIGVNESEHFGVSADKVKYLCFLPAETVRSLQIYQSIFPELGFSQDMLTTASIQNEQLAENLRKIPLNEEQFCNLVQKFAAVYLKHAPREIPDDKSDVDKFKFFLKNELPGEFSNADESVFDYIAQGIISPDFNNLDYASWLQKRSQDSKYIKQQNLFPKGRIIRYADLLTLEERLQEFSTSGDDRAVWTHVKPYSDIQEFGYAASPHINVRAGRMLDPPGQEVKGRDSVSVDFLTFGYSESASLEPSAGNNVMQEFGRHFRAVELFFAQNKLPPDNYLFDFSNIEYTDIQQKVRRALMFIPKQYRIDIGIHIPALEITVPENSGLAFIADEPTVYLDAKNQSQLTGQLFELPRLHPRLQLIIATNDRDMIRAAPEGTVYVVCQKGKPIISTRKYRV